MIIEYDLAGYLVNEEASMKEAADCLAKSGRKVIFVVNHSRRLLGVVTNGDILRGIAKEGFSGESKVTDYYNTKYFSINQSDRKDIDLINENLKKFAYIPILDSNHHIVGVARRRSSSEEIKIDKFSISESSPSFVIAEVGNNHNGSLELAKKLVVLAKRSGADCVKFQMRTMGTLYHRESAGNLGEEYVLDLLDRFQLKDEELFEVFDYCKELGILALCTPWDFESLKKLEEYGIPAYKVASADLTNHELLVEIAKTGKPMICSTGMATTSEIEEAVTVLNESGAKYVLLHCNSTYPSPFSDINLKYLKTLEELSGGVVGYSGHERGYEVPIAAVAMGAKIIEKHFTVDRAMEGNDHKVSLLPEEFSSMVNAIRNVEQSLGTGGQRVISQGEMMNRVTLAKSVIVNRDVSKGEEITAQMLEIKSPGKGLQPNRKNELIGKTSLRDMKKGDFFYPSDLEEGVEEVKDYQFPILWGVPVRFHDFHSMVKKCPYMNFVEFHLSYKDLEVDISEVFNGSFQHQFAVHSPELFFGDHVMDLCSKDDEYRQRSISELKRVIEMTKSLKKYFPNTQKPQIICNVGGFTHDAPLGKAERQELYSVLERSLMDIDTQEVEIIPQTMPPFPWHMGGQQFHNLFVNPDEIVSFCERNKTRICFDVSHSGLACNHDSYSFTEFVDKVLPFTAHLHIADAFGSDGEGMQIGKGNLDFKYLFNKISNSNDSNMTFIPEIWQGHENDGEGFWIGLSKLEKIINRGN